MEAGGPLPTTDIDANIATCHPLQDKKLTLRPSEVLAHPFRTTSANREAQGNAAKILHQAAPLQKCPAS